MANDEGIDFTLPSIPYFYHDLVARIVPGCFQLGLLGVLLHHSCPKSVDLEGLSSLLNASQFGVLLAVLAASYFIGVLFEGLLYFSVGNVRLVSRFYHRGFAAAMRDARRNRQVTGDIDHAAVLILAEESSSILETFEPFAPHFFARATRFLAEAKMLMYSAVAIPVAVAVAGAITGSLWPLDSCLGAGLVSVSILLLLFASAARQRRRAVEILRCIEYLASRTEPADAKDRARRARDLILASDVKDSKHAAQQGDGAGGA